MNHTEGRAAVKNGATTLRVELMDAFRIYVNDRQVRELTERSRKGAALLQYLILRRGATVGRKRLIDLFWQDEDSANPESALKTLVSRLRKALGDSAGPAFAECIGSGEGGYRWVCVPGTSVDVYELEDALDRLDQNPGDAERDRLAQRVLELYTGDLLEQTAQGQSAWVVSRAASLHRRALDAAAAYARSLNSAGNHQEAAEVCRQALDIDGFDDRLHIELMNALVRMGRTNEALTQYRHVSHLYSRFLGMPLSDELREFYDHIAKANRSVEFSLEAISAQLREGDSERGAFVCEYTVFKEVFNLQMRALQRSGTDVFLAVIMVEGSADRVLDHIEQDQAMECLRNILQENLRRGDTVTRFSPTVFALLLPTVNYRTGNMVMERMKRLFYRQYPSSDIEYKYLIGPLTHPEGEEAPRSAPQQKADG